VDRLIPSPWTPSYKPPQGAFSTDQSTDQNIRTVLLRHDLARQNIVEITTTPKEDLPVNPGVLPPSTTLGRRRLSIRAFNGSGNRKTGPVQVDRRLWNVIQQKQCWRLKPSGGQSKLFSGLQWLATSTGNMDCTTKIEASQASTRIFRVRDRASFA
jgi:hypothetical protein